MQGKIQLRCNGCQKLLDVGSIIFDTAMSIHPENFMEKLSKPLREHRSSCSYYGKGVRAERLLI